MLTITPTWGVCSGRRGKPCSSSSTPLPRLYSLCLLCHSSLVPSSLISSMMKTSHSRPEAALSLSHPPTSSIINGCFHDELLRVLNHSQSCFGERGTAGAWHSDISADMLGYFKKIVPPFFLYTHGNSQSHYNHQCKDGWKMYCTL